MEIESERVFVGHGTWNLAGGQCRCQSIRASLYDAILRCWRCCLSEHLKGVPLFHWHDLSLPARGTDVVRHYSMPFPELAFAESRKITAQHWFGLNSVPFPKFLQRTQLFASSIVAVVLSSFIL